MIRHRSTLVLAVGAAVLFGTSCAERSSTAPPVASVTTIVALPYSNDLVGVAGYALDGPLRVQVFVDGAAAPDVEVEWTATGGVVAPQSSKTNALGIVAAKWVLGVVPGVQTLTARVKDAREVFVEIAVVVREEVRLELVSSVNRQIGTVATTLPQPLRVRVTSNGVPRAGVPIFWAGEGEASSAGVSDVNGIAEAMWTLSTRAGSQEMRASVLSQPGPPLTFSATALAGAVTRLLTTQGAGLSLPANRFAFDPLRVTALDQYSNVVAQAKTIWSIVSGPALVFSAESSTDAYGHSTALIAPVGLEGTALVRVASGSAAQSFTLTITSAEFLITLNTNNMRFESRQNGSSAAVDTVNVGQLVSWRLAPFDYDQHSVEIVGPSTNTSLGEFPYANPSEIRWRPTLPGTYHYSDRYYGATGILVVK